MVYTGLMKPRKEQFERRVRITDHPAARSALIKTFKNNERLGGHIMVGDKNHEVIGELLWHPTGEIKDVKVRDEYKRTGIATKMLKMAKTEARRAKQPNIKHSPIRTDEGDAWAKKVGGTLPKRAED
jgi:predicted GNAT family acetyltransferase